MSFASIVVCARNASTTLGRTLESLLSIPAAEFEIVIIDDCSTDGTYRVAKSFESRGLVRIFRNNKNCGAGEARNLGIREARGEVVFFIDADCWADSDWIAEGLRSLTDPKVVAVEGAIYYQNIRPLFSEQVPLNPFYQSSHDGCRTQPGRDYSSCNFAARRSALLRTGGFNGKRYRNGREDTDLGLRLRNEGLIVYNEAMRVTHGEQHWNVRKLLRNALRYEADVRLRKDYGSFFFAKGRVLHPQFLLFLLCPPLIFVRFRFSTLRELLFVPKFYCYLVVMRLVIWRTAFREGILVF